MIRNIEIVSGPVRRDIHGSWSDCDPGLYLDSDRVETIFSKYIGNNIRVTIEVIPNTPEYEKRMDE